MCDIVNISKLKADLKRDEGLKLKPYQCTAGKTTIGVGRNLDDVGISKDEADYLLNNDIINVMRTLDIAMPYWQYLSEPRQRALANMCHNLGLQGLLGFKNMLRCIRERDYEGAARESLDSKWAKEDVSKDRSSRIAQMLKEG